MGEEELAYKLDGMKENSREMRELGEKHERENAVYFTLMHE
jgi:hypothetical protein